MIRAVRSRHNQGPKPYLRSLREIGAIMGISHARVGQIEEDAIIKLQRELEAEFRYDYLKANGQEDIVVDIHALESATKASFAVAYPDLKWSELEDDAKARLRNCTAAAIEEYQRQTLKGYAERIEKKGNNES